MLLVALRPPSQTALLPHFSSPMTRVSPPPCICYQPSQGMDPEGSAPTTVATVALPEARMPTNVNATANI
jgi:hypothetical protein